MADEPVVVLKFRPTKAGNSVEEKTETIMGGDSMGLYSPKSNTNAKG